VSHKGNSNNNNRKQAEVKTRTNSLLQKSGHVVHIFVIPFVVVVLFAVVVA